MVVCPSLQYRNLLKVLLFPRSSARLFQNCCDDLERAETLLAPFTGAGQWMSGDNYGRVTSGTAVALLGQYVYYMPVRYLIAQ